MEGRVSASPAPRRALRGRLLANAFEVRLGDRRAQLPIS